VVNLSPEGLFALIGLAHSMMSEKDWHEQWEATTNMIVANNPVAETEE
jgi:hypothetical protein